MTSTFIRNVHLVDPVQKIDERTNILIRDGRIHSVGPELSSQEQGANVIDADGRIGTPGLIDLHVHLREPGHEYKETIATGTKAAVAGGFTAVASMANTDPPNDSAAITKFILERAAQANNARVHPIGCVTKGMRGKELAEIGEMVRAGIVAISDDGLPVQDPNVMRRAMEYAIQFDVPIIEHCETPELHPKGVMNEGYWSTRLGLAGIPAASEAISVGRNVELAALTGARFHVAHLSTRRALQKVAEAKDRGLRVTCEVTPHHLVLTDEAVQAYDTNTKMKPPLCSKEDRDALVDGLSSGTVDTIATDHAAHHQDEKELAYDDAPFGIVGLETALPIVLDRLVNPGIISLARLVELMSINPARILGVQGGTLPVGSPADITLIDLAERFVVNPGEFYSKGKNSPFGGWELTGRAWMSIVNGRIAWRMDER